VLQSSLTILRYLAISNESFHSNTITHFIEKLRFGNLLQFHCLHFIAWDRDGVPLQCWEIRDQKKKRQGQTESVGGKKMVKGFCSGV